MAPIHPTGILGHPRCYDQLLGIGVEEVVAKTTKDQDDTNFIHEVARKLEGVCMCVLPLPMREITICL